MTLELEREIIGQLILSPSLFESSDLLRAGLFSDPDLRKLFGACSSVWEELRPGDIDSVILAEKTGLREDFIMGLVSGNYRPDPANFAWKVRRLHVKQTSKRILKLAQDEGQSLVKTGEIDDARLKEIRGLFLELEEKPTAGPAVLPLSSIDPQSISFLWPGRIPLGMLSLIAGSPGQGKSILTIAIAAALSRGRALPGAGEPLSCSSLFLAAEDPVAQAVRPRADANDADCSRLFVLPDMDFDPEALIARLEETLNSNADIKFVVLDPLNGFLKGGADYFRDPEVRRALLRPLAALAEKSGAAICGVVHLRKDETGGALNRVAGSLAYAAAARSVLAVAPDPNDEGRRFVLPLKANYSARPDNLAFRIEPTLRVIFEAAPDVDAEEVLGRQDPEQEGEHSFAVEWLRGALSEPKTIREIEADARREHISRATLFRARRRLRVISRASGFGPGRTTTWELPS